MAAEPELNRVIQLEAPDALILGLLGVLSAEKINLREGELLPLSPLPGQWILAGLSRGGVSLTASGGSFLLEAGQAAALSGGEVFSLCAQGDAAVGLLTLSGTAADTVMEGARQRGGLFFPTGGSALSALLGHFEALSRQGTVSAAEGSSSAYELLLSLIPTACAPEGRRRRLPAVVAEALSRMQQDYLFLEGIGELADQLGVSQEYLTRAFSTHLGMTPGRYLNRLRVEHAKQLLREHQHTVAFISDACGFANPNYFARVFRGLTGLTPSQYARALGETAQAPDSLPDAFYVL